MLVADYRPSLAQKRARRAEQIWRRREPAGRNKISPGRKPWVGRKLGTRAPAGAAQNAHQTQFCAVPGGLVIHHNAFPGLTSWATFVPPSGLGDLQMELFTI